MTNKTYSGTMSKDQLKNLLQYGSTQIQVGESTYVDVRLTINDGDDMKEYAEMLGEQTASMAFEAGIVTQQEKDNE